MCCFSHGREAGIKREVCRIRQTSRFCVEEGRKKRENRVVVAERGSLSYDFMRTLMVRGDHLGTSFDEVGCLG